MDLCVQNYAMTLFLQCLLGTHLSPTSHWYDSICNILLYCSYSGRRRFWTIVEVNQFWKIVVKGAKQFLLSLQRCPLFQLQIPSAEPRKIPSCEMDDWLADRAAYQLTDWLKHWTVDCAAHKLIDRVADFIVDCEPYGMHRKTFARNKKNSQM